MSSDIHLYASANMYAHVHLQTQMHQTKLQFFFFFLSNQFKFHTKTNSRVNKIKDAKNTLIMIKKIKTNVQREGLMIVTVNDLAQSHWVCEIRSG